MIFGSPVGVVHDLTVSHGELRDLASDSRLGCREVEIAAPLGTRVTVDWQAALAGAIGYWTSRVGVTKAIGSDWALPLTADLTAEAPVALLFDAQSRCSHAVAVSETLTEVAIRLAASEELNVVLGHVAFTAGSDPTRLRLYPAGGHYEDVLTDVANWWAVSDPLSGSGTLPEDLPAAATEPVYSTWYGMHQQLAQEALDDELERAAGMGMGAVIVDDGWQTEDDQRGYAFTGDWQVAGSRFPDLRAHVERTHRLGMAELLWLSLPFVGRESRAARELEHLLLPDEERRMARLWDVRLPAARAHVADICRRLVADHALDGLKIDFIDQWSSYPVTPTPAGADTDSYAVGVDRLLSVIVDELCAVLPSPLLEFRQRYCGPRMQRYGNLFRVADCPANGLQNRVSSVDLRHLIKSRVVHSDMVMWAPDDPAEDAAEQLLCAAFSVPQISMLLADLPEDHLAMLRHFLSWWQRHRDVLLWGRLTAPRPDLNYPVITATTAEDSVTVAYAAEAVSAVPVGRAVLANATGGTSVVVDVATSSRVTSVVDCFGVAHPEVADLTPGLHRVPLPRGGSWVIESL